MTEGIPESPPPPPPPPPPQPPHEVGKKKKEDIVPKPRKKNPEEIKPTDIKSQLDQRRKNARLGEYFG